MVAPNDSEPSPPSAEDFYPDFSRRRRVFPRQQSPVAWLLPVAVFVVGILAVSRLLPNLSTTPAAFGASYVAQHESARKKATRARAVGDARAEAESIAVRLRLPPGLLGRLVAIDARPLRVRIGHAFNEHQLHVVFSSAQVGVASVFEERFAPRTLTDYRRHVIDDALYYVSSAPTPKGARDSVVIWSEPGTLLTLVGTAPEDSLVACADRLRRMGL
jgi:hypothetical protein